MDQAMDGRSSSTGKEAQVDDIAARNLNRIEVAQIVGYAEKPVAREEVTKHPMLQGWDPAVLKQTIDGAVEEGLLTVDGSGRLTVGERGKDLLIIPDGASESYWRHVNS